MVDPTITGVPVSNDAMIKTYGKVIMGEIYKRNIVRGNTEDLFQTVCLKLVEANILKRFVQRVLNSSDDPVPETMTVSEICDLFKINTTDTWIAKMSSYHRRFLLDMGGKVPAGSPLSTHGTIKKNGKYLVWTAWMPTPISGRPCSTKAVFKTTDIMTLHEMGYFKSKDFKIAAWPPRAVQPHHFQAYLVRAVRNHFINACRTIHRKHKDRPGQCFQQFDGPDGEYNDSWTDSLEDPLAETSIEASARLSQKMEQLADIAEDFSDEQRGAVYQLLSKNHTIREVVERVHLPPVQVRRLLKLCEA